MPKIPHSRYRYGDDELWKQKRGVWFKPDATKTAEPIEAAKEKKDIGQERINKHRGMSPEQAQDAAKDMLKANSAEISRVQKVKERSILRSTANILTLGITSKIFTNAGRLNKQQVRALIEDAAKLRVKAEADKMTERGINAAAHTQDSIAIMTENIRASNELHNNLEQDIRQKEQLRDAYKENLRWFSSGSELGTLNKEIGQLQGVQAKATELREEYEAKIDKKGEKVQRIQQLESGIMNFIGGRSPEDRPILAAALKEAVLSRDKNIFLKLAYQEGPRKNSPDRKAVSAMLGILINGETGLGFGKFNANDVNQYFLRKVIEEKAHDLNMDTDSVKERTERLGKSPLGTKIQIDGESYYLIKQESQGFLLKNAEYPSNYAYINMANPSKPLLTQEVLGKKGEFEAPKELAIDNAATEKEGGKKSVNFSSKAIASLEAAPETKTDTVTQIIEVADIMAASVPSAPPVGGGL